MAYESHEKEKKLIYESLKRRAQIVSKGLDTIPGFSCQSAQGALYCFPQIELPAGAIKAAADQNLSPDTLYALDLLQHTGLCVVPAQDSDKNPVDLGLGLPFYPQKKLWNL